MRCKTVGSQIRMIGNDVIFDYSKGYPMPQYVVGFDEPKYKRWQEKDRKKKRMAGARV